MNPKINLIIDSNYLCYVHKFALSQGLTYRGGRTEIIFGFLKTVFELSAKFESDKFLFCWDSRDSIRKEIYPNYKANRRVDRTEEEKANDKIAFHQFSLLREEILPRMGFRNIYFVDKYESDDLMAKLVKSNLVYKKNIIVSSDSDLFQLLDFCSLYNVSKRWMTTKLEFIRTYGILPYRWSEVKSISGCSTDNVSGISRVGEKTAVKYLTGQLKEGKIKQAIESAEGQEIIRINKELVSIPFCGLPDLKIEEEEFRTEDFLAIFGKYGLSSFDKGIATISERFRLR